ncbi:MAG: hypothetical protein KOO60_12315 [Gemmatimonadales bacterium]|nr:hypothetical protein [Gemmatimonadales bacterium]
MKRLIPIPAILILSIPFVLLAGPNDDPAIAVDSGPPATADGPEAFPPTTTLSMTIETIRQNALVSIQKLSNRLTSVPQGSLVALDLQEQISLVKTQTEISILEAVVEDAALSGDLKRQKEAEAALERLTHPEKYVTPATPVERPAPSR